MARLRFLAVALLALALVGSPTQTGRSADDTDKATIYPAPAVSVKYPATDDSSCVIYALADMGYDGDLGAWIARTIPEMIEPKSWQELGGAGTLRYYAPKNILIIKQPAAIQAKVDGFLKDLKKSMPKGSKSGLASGKKSSPAIVVPAAYPAPAVLRASSPTPDTISYPVPAPVKPPKHLFHFLIRYEGDGIIDDNVVKSMKAYYDAANGAASQLPSAAPTYAGGRADTRSTVPPATAPTVLAPSDPGVAPAPAGAEAEAKDAKKKEDKKEDKKDSSDNEPY